MINGTSLESEMEAMNIATSSIDDHYSDNESVEEHHALKDYNFKMKYEEKENEEKAHEFQQIFDKDDDKDEEDDQILVSDNIPIPDSLPNNEMAHDDEQLSTALAIFLSNPALKSGLSDGSLDLSRYHSVVESELASLEKECISVYRKNKDDIVTLSKEIDVCDGVLAALQEMLLGFQADLGGLSGDIRALQNQSRTLGIQLRNRRDAESGLRRFLEKVVIPPNLADVICHGAVDETFMLCVQELNRKYQYVHSDDTNVIKSNSLVDEAEKRNNHFDLSISAGVSPKDTIAGTEMRFHIDRLRLAAVTRIREYFLSKIIELRKPRTNVRMIQENALLKYTALNDFLHEAKPEIFHEIREVYTESMGKTLGALFRTYMAQLSRLEAKIATRHDLIAVEDANLRDVFSTKVNLSKSWDTFFLGDRASVLDRELDSNDNGNGNSNISKEIASTRSSPILAHVAQAEGEKYPYEMIFRSVMQHLMDSATNEFIFTRLFFKESGKSAYNRVLSRTLSLVLEQIENYLFNCYDCLTLLLLIKLTHANRRIMKARRVNALDNFFDRITMLLWPRLKMIMDAQLRSIRMGNAKRLGGVELHAHYVSRRFAEFTCSMLLILNRGKQRYNANIKERSNNFPPSTPGTTTAQNEVSMPFQSEEQLKNNTAPEEVRTKVNRSPSISSTSLESIPSRSSQHSIVQSSPRGSAGDMLMNDLALLQKEIIVLLERLSDDLSTNKRKIVFMINNLDQIITVFAERRVVGKELMHFRELLMQQRELFVEEELLQNFSKMIAFVQQTEMHFMNLTSGDRLEVNIDVVQNLVEEFSSNWKQGIEQINKNVLSYFSNFRNGMEILKQVLTQLLLYYTRFQDIIRKVWRSKPPAFCKDLVSTTYILSEIKKFALSI